VDVTTLTILVVIEASFIAIGCFMLGVQFASSVRSGASGLNLMTIIGFSLVTAGSLLVAITLKILPVRTDIAALTKEISTLIQKMELLIEQLRTGSVN